MDYVHLHLILNHVPVVGAVFAVMLLAIAWMRRSAELTRISFGFLGLLGAFAIAVYLTGEPTEHAVENLPGVSEPIMERHEEVALIATVASAALGALALIALVAFRRRVVPRWTTVAGLLAAIAVVGLMGYTANLGGQIRHTEIRSDQVAGQADAERSGQPRSERDDR